MDKGQLCCRQQNWLVYFIYHCSLGVYGHLHYHVASTRRTMQHSFTAQARINCSCFTMCFDWVPLCSHTNPRLFESTGMDTTAALVYSIDLDSRNNADHPLVKCCEKLFSTVAGWHLVMMCEVPFLLSSKFGCDISCA